MKKKNEVFEKKIAKGSGGIWTQVLSHAKPRFYRYSNESVGTWGNKIMTYSRKLGQFIW